MINSLKELYRKYDFKRDKIIGADAFIYKKGIMFIEEKWSGCNIIYIKIFTGKDAMFLFQNNDNVSKLINYQLIEKHLRIYLNLDPSEFELFYIEQYSKL